MQTKTGLMTIIERKRRVNTRREAKGRKSPILFGKPTPRQIQLAIVVLGKDV